MMSERTPPAAPAIESDTSDKQQKTIDSNDLFDGARELVIRHNQDRYILRITRQGKLILNK